MTQSFALAQPDRSWKPIDLDTWDEWERCVGSWQLSGCVSKGPSLIENQDELSIPAASQIFTGADVFLAGRCTAFQKRPGSAPAARSRRPSSASSTSGGAAAMSFVHSQPSIAASGLDISKQGSAQQALRESLVQQRSKELRLRLKALGKSSKASAVPRSKMPMRPDPSAANLTPRSGLALEAALAQGSLLHKRLQVLLERKPGAKDDASFDEKVAEAQKLKELVSEMSGSLTLGKAAEAELHHFNNELHKIKIVLQMQEKRQQALAATNADLKEANYIARVQNGLKKDFTGGRQRRSLTRLASCSASKPRKLEGKDARESKLKRTLTRLEGSVGKVANHACTAVDERRHKIEMAMASQKGSGAYKGKCCRTATAEGLQHTLLELLRQRERVAQYRDDSISMEREMSKHVEALRAELNTVEFNQTEL